MSNLKVDDIVRVYGIDTVGKKFVPYQSQGTIRSVDDEVIEVSFSETSIIYGIFHKKQCEKIDE